MNDLSDTQIRGIANKLGMSRKLISVCSRDRLPQQPYRGAYIINKQGFNQGDMKGTHWVLLVVKSGGKGSIFFDSFADQPPVDVSKFAPAPLEVSHREIQSLSSHACGYFCLYVMYQICMKGRGLKDVVNQFCTSNKMCNDALLASFFRGK